MRSTRAEGVHHGRSLHHARSAHHVPKERITQKSLICLVNKSGFFVGAGNRTRFAFSPLEKIMEWFPSSRKPATRPRRVAFRWVRVLFFSIRNIKEEAFGLLFYIWCGQQDSNLHGRPLEPKSNVSANSTMPAYSVESGEWTVDSYCFAVFTIAVNIFSNSLQSL